MVDLVSGWLLWIIGYVSVCVSLRSRDMCVCMCVACVRACVRLGVRVSICVGGLVYINMLFDQLYPVLHIDWVQVNTKLDPNECPSVCPNLTPARFEYLNI